MSLPSPSSDGRRLLEACLGDVDAFLDEDLGRRHRLHRADPASGGDLTGLLTVDDVDDLITARSLRAPAFRLVQEGRTLPRATTTRSGRVGGVPVDDLPDPGRILDLVADGATLVLQALHRSWPPVTALCRALEDLVGHPVQANAYLTPPGSRGLAVHHDTHDVLAIQLSGDKHWVVHEPAVVAPLPGQRWSRDDHTPGPLVLDTVLHPGDVLYLPRGTPHAAETTDAASLHLTVGIRSVTWFDVLQRVLADAADEPRFRDALPPGYADDPDGLAAALQPVLKDAAAWLADRDATVVAEREVTRAHQSRAPDLRGQLAHVLALDEVDADVAVTPRPGQRVRVHTDGDRIVLDLADRQVRLPAGTRPAIDAMLADAPVRVGDLPGLDDASQVVLARRLVREGVLVVVDADGPVDG